MRLNALINNVSALQSFQMMRFSALILIGIILVKLGYSTEEIGFYELFFFLANLLSFFWSMGLKNALVSYFPKLIPIDQKKLLFNLALILLVLGYLGASFLYLFEDYIAYLLNGGNDIPNLKILMLYLVLAPSSAFVVFIYLLLEENKNIIRYGMVIYSAQILIISYATFNKFSVESILALVTMWMGIQFIWFCKLILKKGILVLDFNLIKVFLVFSLPLILHMLLGNGMDYMDGFLVNYFFDESTFAQFKYGARELPFTTILVGALSTAMIPVAVNNLNYALEDMTKKLTNLVNILFPISIVLILISPFIFPIVFSEDFKISARIFNVYLLVISSRVLMPQVVLFSQHKNNFLLISAVLEMLINVSLSIILLNYMGILGIAWATVIAYMCNKIILILFVNVKFNIPISRYLNVKLYLIWLFLLMISYYISTLYH